MANAPTQASPAQLAAMNRQLRDNLIANSRYQRISIFKSNIDVDASRTITIPLRNVGLINRLKVNVQLDIQSQVAGGGANLVRTAWGGFNSVSRFKLTDYVSNDRINAKGRQIGSINSLRSGRGYLASESLPGFVADYGPNNNRVQYTPQITPGSTVSAFSTHLIPIAYSPLDLRGSLFGNVRDSTSYLEITLPSDAEVSYTGNSGGHQLAVDAMYYGGAAKVVGATIEVVQEHYDALPRYTDGPLAGQYALPTQDLQLIYEIKAQRYTEGFAPGGKLKVPYANGRNFLNVGLDVLNGAAPSFDGQGIRSISLVQANTYQWFDLDPRWLAVDSRERMGLDSPVGHYDIDTRSTPINTEAAGNIEINIELTPDATISTNPPARVDAVFEAIGLAPTYSTGIVSI